MAIFDATSAIGSIITGLANTTGSLFLALFIIMIALFAIAMLLKVPIEITVPVFVPFIIVAVIITSSFLQILGIVILYFAIITAKNFLF